MNKVPSGVYQILGKKSVAFLNLSHWSKSDFENLTKNGNIVEVKNFLVSNEKKILKIDAIGKTKPRCIHCDKKITAKKEHLPDYPMLEESFNKDAERALSVLNDNEQQVLRYCFGLNCDKLKKRTIGHLMGLKKSQVKQIKKRAILKLRQSNDCHLILKKYVS